MKLLRLTRSICTRVGGSLAAVSTNLRAVGDGHVLDILARSVCSVEARLGSLIGCSRLDSSSVLIENKTSLVRVGVAARDSVRGIGSSLSAVHIGNLSLGNSHERNSKDKPHCWVTAEWSTNSRKNCFYSVSSGPKFVETRLVSWLNSGRGGSYYPMETF